MINKFNKVSPHILFWGLIIVFSSFRELVFHPNYFDLLKLKIILAATYSVFIYYHYYVLLPKLIENKNFYFYIPIVVIGIIFSSIIGPFILVEIANWFWGIGQALEWYNTTFGRLIVGSEFFMILCLSTAIFFMEKWLQKDRYAKELEKQNLEAELTNLKNQINPHFVFNSLNTIYHLIPSSAKEAKDLLLNFSDSLSHQLYDAQKKRVLLKNEIEYLKNYISIEKARSGELLDLSTDWPDHLNGEMIPPMLLIPLVENAFKHSKNGSTCQVKIKAMVGNHTLLFSTENNIGDLKKNQLHSGIGLQNLTRRLELLFPNKHSFEVHKVNDTFVTSLKIDLNED